jgi:tetratricopeptide (TPR) repeat protein
MLGNSKYASCFIALALAIGAHAAEPPEAMQHARTSYELATRGDLSGAAEEMRAAVRIAPENALYMSALGGIVARLGKTEDAIEYFERAVKLDPQNPALLIRLEEISLDLGAELAKQHRFKAGLLLAQKTAGRSPESARAQQMLGLFLMRNHQNPAAVEAYQKALALSPESSDISVGLGIAETLAGMLPQAVQSLEEGIAKWPADSLHYQAYGVLLLRMAQEGAVSEEKGIRMLQKALALNPALAEAHYQLGNVALTRGDVEEAIGRLSMALRNGDESSKVHFALSRAYRAAGNTQESEKYAALFRDQKAREQQAESKQ